MLIRYTSLLIYALLILEEDPKNDRSTGDLEMSDMPGLKVARQGKKGFQNKIKYIFDVFILGGSADGSTQDLMTTEVTQEDAPDGGWFSKPPKDEDVTEPDWVPLTWHSKLPRLLPFSLLIPGELY